jgi:hypothetical protein
MPKALPSPKLSGNLPRPDSVTIPWLIAHVPISMWISALAIVTSAFSAGMAATKLPFVQSAFATQKNAPLGDFINKAVTERGNYVIEANPSPIYLHVADVSVARKVVTIEIGSAGSTRERIDVRPNQERVIPLGAKVYSFVVHDMAAATLGPDIAVVSFVEKRP